MQSQHKMFLSKILNKHANPTLLNCSMCLLLTSCPQTSQQAFSVLIILLSLNVSVHAYLCVCDLGFLYTSSGGCLSVYWQMLNVSLGLRGHPLPSTLNICTLTSLTLHLGPKSGHVSQCSLLQQHADEDFYSSHRDHASREEEAFILWPQTAIHSVTNKSTPKQKLTMSRSISSTPIELMRERERN